MKLCLLTAENKKESVKENVWFTEDVKQSSKTGTMCTINGDMFCSFTKITWIGDSGASCHVTNNDTGMYDIIDINELTQASSGIMPTTKKSKLCVKVQQVDENEQIHTLWPMKCCSKAGANLFSLSCKLLQVKKISSNHQSNIVVSSTCSDIILDHQIKTHIWLGH